MRIRILSDLHLEFRLPWRWPEDRENYDLVVAAGDIENSCPKAVEALAGLGPTVFVPGNHDHAHVGAKAAPAFADLAAELGQAAFRVLGATPTMIVGRAFVGTPFWYPVSSEQEQALHDFAWYDLRSIPDFVPMWKSACALEETFRPAGGTIVVTHFLPSYELVHSQYEGDPRNRFFVNPRGDRILEDCAPAAWLYGHTHSWTDKNVRSTRCICRPFGYPRESELLDLDRWHADCTFTL